MALHWEHVKGFYGDSNGTLYTYIEFQKSATAAGGLPFIWVSNSNLQGQAPTDQTATNLGHIVTNLYQNVFGVEQEFDDDVDFNSTVHVGANVSMFFDSASIVGNGNNLDIIGTLITMRGSVSVTGSLEVGTTLTVTSTSHCIGKITCDSSIDATFFNATSDKRAKDNLMSISGSMLDIVRNVQVYTFNYKNDPTNHSIGILAQDVQDLNLNGASLVENEKATGLNGDYMKLHESKLVYVLW